MSINKKGNNSKIVSSNLKKYSSMTEDALFKKFNTGEKGLNSKKLEDIENKYGKNIIEEGNVNTTFNRIKESLINPFNIVLIVVAIITFITDVVIATNKDYATFILIILAVVISTVISYLQATKSDNAVQELKNMIKNKVDVIRDNNKKEIDVEEVYPGDIVVLSSGDMIPGDIIFIETKDLFVDQSSLTGESNPVEKFMVLKDENASITDLSNVGFMGTNIVSGSAKAIVVATSTNTYFGTMAKSLYTVKEKNSFELGIERISTLLIRLIVVMVPLILLINVLAKKDLIDSLLFAVTIAVGLTPEMLPVIMTSTLAKGATVMSKKKTIVKRLPSIQTLGEMNILCTDKTGTLTENKIVLEKYLNVDGKEDIRILKHAFLNSYFQTGLKNLMDKAIINRADIENLSDLKSKYVKEDEIPFDFTRRRMSVVVKDTDGKRQLITKGAVEEVLSICSFIEDDGYVRTITTEIRQKALDVYKKYNDQGLRVLAIAQKNSIHGVDKFGTRDEKDMVLIGFVGFLDPPKSSAQRAINNLRKCGIETAVLTGDSLEVSKTVCEKVGIDTTDAITGIELDKLTDEEVTKRISTCRLFAKLSPLQKQRVVRLFQENGNTVGYMGDGINDAAPMKQADIGISVDNAVDIAKETADVILLEKDLNVLEDGVINGRKTFTNVIKYIKMATSGNFGNMLSLMISSIFLPFLPLLPIHIMMQNILCDFAQIGMPFDNVEDEYIRYPKKWNTVEIRKFMFRFGFISSIFDIICFLVLWNIHGFCSYKTQTLFQTGWFAFGIISQTLIIHSIRTDKSILKSKASKELYISTISIVIITLLMTFTPLATLFELARLPLLYLVSLIMIFLLYAACIQVYKNIYMGKKKKKSWL